MVTKKLEHVVALYEKDYDTII